MYSPAPTSYMPGFNPGAPQGQPQLTLAQLMQLRQMMPHAFGNPQMGMPQPGMQPGMPPQGMQMPPQGLGAPMGMMPQMPQQGLGMLPQSPMGARSLR